jgi:hypothetical protein
MRFSQRTEPDICCHRMSLEHNPSVDWTDTDTPSEEFLYRRAFVAQERATSPLQPIFLQWSLIMNYESNVFVLGSATIWVCLKR